MKDAKPKLFPFGIFIFLLLFLILSSTFIIGLYFYINTQNQISTIERETKDYAITLTNACAQIAESSTKKNLSSGLNKFFRKNNKKNIYFKAFFVLKNGKILAHSDLEEKKSLKNNIATDEFSYNISQILGPLKHKKHETLFVDYHIYEKEIPFSKQNRKLLKKYIYSEIDKNGWLSTRAILRDKKKIGTVNFIITKDKIYQEIFRNIAFAKRNAVRAYAFSFIFSLFFALIVLLRYQSIRLKIMATEKYKHAQKTRNLVHNNGSNYNPKEAIHNVTNMPIRKIVDNQQPTEVNYIYEEKDDIAHPDDELRIHDAIPIRSRRSR